MLVALATYFQSPSMYQYCVTNVPSNHVLVTGKSITSWPTGVKTSNFELNLKHKTKNVVRPFDLPPAPFWLITHAH